jgi:hypothetical protein
LYLSKTTRHPAQAGILVGMPGGRLSGHLTYGNVVATLALFVALGGASYAAVMLPANSVGSRQLRSGAVEPRNLAFPLGAASVTNPKLDEIGNGACNGPLFPGEIPPPCVPPVVSQADPGDSLRLQVRAPVRLSISAIAGLSDKGEAQARATVTLRVIVDRRVATAVETGVRGGQMLQTPAQALVPAGAGLHTVGVSVDAEYAARPENVIVAPVSIVVAELPAVSTAR